MIQSAGDVVAYIGMYTEHIIVSCYILHFRISTMRYNDYNNKYSSMLLRRTHGSRTMFRRQVVTLQVATALSRLTPRPQYCTTAVVRQPREWQCTGARGWTARRRSTRVNPTPIGPRAGLAYSAARKPHNGSSLRLRNAPRVIHSVFCIHEELLRHERVRRTQIKWKNNNNNYYCYNRAQNALRRCSVERVWCSFIKKYVCQMLYNILFNITLVTDLFKSINN